MKLIHRSLYLQKLIDVIGTPDIKVITGVRRSGKSKLLEAFKDYIQKTDANANLIHVNFNLLEFQSLTTYEKLNSYVESKFVEGKNNFVLIVEVQMCEGFEKTINNLHALEKYDLYITGSNAFLLSSDLATLFTGRTFKLEIFPFSFTEFCEYFEFTNTDTYAAFDRYLKEGGMAGSYPYKDLENKYNYIEDVFKTLIVRDIKQKYKIRNQSVMDSLVDFLIDNVSNLISSRNIADTLAISKVKIEHKTVAKYLDYLCNAYAFYKIKRYDIQGKKYLSTSDKYYLSDHVFKYAILGNKNPNRGRLFENIVAIELLRRCYEIYVGVLYKKEIDFVAIKRDEKVYIQVSDDISSEETFEREVSPLLKIKDAYPKIVIAKTNQEKYQFEGVQIFDIANWLLGEK
ncbi:MAG: ATP-binding protein [Succinatimonas sp.]|nr:ATP-binding protein [Succinatimonas sp.]